MKKLCIFLFVALLAVWLAGCGQGVSSSGSKANADVASETPNTIENAKPPQTENANSGVDEPEQPLTVNPAKEELDSEPLSPLGGSNVTPADFQMAALTWKDQNGYEFEATYTFSMWIEYGNEDLLYATWKSVAGDVPFPDFSENMPYGQSMQYDGNSLNHDSDIILYTIGTLKIRNATENFDITSANPQKVPIEFRINTPFAMMALLGDSAPLRAFHNGMVSDGLISPDGVGMFLELDRSYPTVEMTSNESSVIPFVVAVSISETTPTPNNPEVRNVPEISEIILKAHQHDWDKGEDIECIFELAY